MKHYLLIGASILGAYLLLVLFFRVYEDRLIYYPQKEQLSDISPLKLEEHMITTSDGNQVHLVFKEQKRDIVFLFCHGNAGNITANLPNLQNLDASGYSYLMFDYPGYGKSSGSPSEQGLYFAGQAVYDFLVKEKLFQPDQIIVNGQSLGVAVCIELASRNPVRSVISESAFASTHAMSRELLKGIPIAWFVSNKFDSLSRVQHLNVPILFIHGEQDQIIPPTHSQRLYAAANEPKFLLTIPDYGHNQVISEASEAFNAAIDEFIETSQISQ